MKTGRYTLTQLLTNSEVEQIIIPEIQRDYVWGERNVKGLLNSIYSNYKKKKTLSLNIECTGEQIGEDIKRYLSEEYQRIRFNTHIGFLYAYHDPTYAGKLFLIDGQQRITTLLLVLLSAYCSNSIEKLKTEYKNKYFRDNLPKLDYKVREVTHDFLISFINYITSATKEEDFSKSANFYDVFRKDITAKTILANYKLITEFLENKNIYNDRQKFIDYIENYVEFNYFDTNLSEQGERLYLYMNSRGKELSKQEIVKTILISQSNEKLNDSKKWEDWQNFFWEKRGDNINADKGFELFLQHATIIYLCTQTEGSHEKKRVPLNFILNNNGLRDYLIENKNINISWLDKVFTSIEKLSSFNAINDGYIKEKWLSNNLNTIDYVPILGCIYYLMLYPDVQELDVKRIGMHLKNICYYERNIKNPDLAIIYSLETISEMYTHHISDIVGIPTLPSETKERFYSNSDERKAELYQTPERDAWEKLFWSIVNDNDLNSFIKGNTAILLDLSDTISPNSVEQTYTNFKDNIYKKRDTTKLRYDMLKYGDFSLSDNGGSDHLSSSWMSRCNLISTDDDWYKLLIDKDKKIIVKNYLLNKYNTSTSLPIIADPSYGCLEYMSQFKFLWDDESFHCILLNKHQASEQNSRELPIQMLHKLLTYNNWICKYNRCVVDFKIEDKKFICAKKNESDFFFDIIYHYDNRTHYWSINIGSRNEKHPISENLIPILKKETSLEWEYILEDGINKCHANNFCKLCESCESNKISFTYIVESVINKFNEIKDKVCLALSNL
jgi:hypothetical protein